MTDWFKDDLTALAFCWRIERLDGVVLGFTSHDRDLVLDGLVYHAAPGMVPSAIERRDSLDPDTMDLAGALTSSLITETDLLAGRWDGARLRVSAVNWAKLPPAGALLFDESSGMDVALLNDSMQLHSCSAEALSAGANAAMAGNELLQFRSAEPLGNNRYRLSGLLRGRRGTEWAIGSHLAGERFILAEREAFSHVDVPPGVGLVRVMAVGIADVVPPEQRLERPGQALLPLSPAHVKARDLANGDTEISWVRRSRNGWRWLDGTDAPLVEETERYLVTLGPNTGLVQTIERLEPNLIYTASARAAARASGAERLQLDICQIGNFGMSRPATMTVSLV